MKPLASRTGRIGTSQTVAIDARYKRLKAEGRDVLSLGAGEPDLDTPPLAKEAAIRSIREGQTKYGMVTGLPALKEAVSRKFKRDNGLDYPPGQVVVSGGAKHAVFNALLALVDEGDEVLIPSPAWVTYPELVRFLGGVPVTLPTTFEGGFKVTAAQVEAAVTPRTKLLILNTPGNPTGAMYGEEELGAIARVIAERDLYCLSDEIYEHIVYEGNRHVSIASLHPGAYDRTVTVNGMSKAYAMTGWRIGYIGAPQPLAAAIGAIQSHGTHHPANASQFAALAGLEEERGFVQELRAHLDDCRRLALGRLAAIPACGSSRRRAPSTHFSAWSPTWGAPSRGRPSVRPWPSANTCWKSSSWPRCRAAASGWKVTCAFPSRTPCRPWKPLSTAWSGASGTSAAPDR